MDLFLERLAPKLESELGADGVSRETGALRAHKLDGKTPALVCWPATPDQVATILRVGAEAKAAVSPWGGGTGANVGNAPPEAWVAIGLGRLNRVIDHDSANLTVTVQSGITLGALRESLSSQRQFLPFDAPQPAQATIEVSKIAFLSIAAYCTCVASVVLIGNRVAREPSECLVEKAALQHGDPA